MARNDVECEIGSIKQQRNGEDPANAKLLWRARAVRTAGPAAVNQMADEVQAKSKCKQHPGANQNVLFVGMDQFMEYEERAAKTNLAAGAHDSDKDRQSATEDVRQLSKKTDRRGGFIQSYHNSVTAGLVQDLPSPSVMIS